MYYNLSNYEKKYSNKRTKLWKIGVLKKARRLAAQGWLTFPEFDVYDGQPIENTGLKLQTNIRRRRVNTSSIDYYIPRRDGPRNPSGLLDVPLPMDSSEKLSLSTSPYVFSSVPASRTSSSATRMLGSSSPSSQAGEAPSQQDEGKVSGESVVEEDEYIDDGSGIYQYFEDDNSSDHSGISDLTIEPKNYRITDRNPLSSGVSRLMSVEEAAAKFSSLCPNHARSEDGNILLHTDPIIANQAWALLSPMTHEADVRSSSSSSSSSQSIDLGAQFATALILASTTDLYNQDSQDLMIEMYTNLEQNYAKLYPIVFAFLTSIINFAFMQSQDPTNDQSFLDPQAIVSYEVVMAITSINSPSKVDTEEVRDMRNEKLKVPMSAALCLVSLLSDEYDKPPHRHFSKDRAAAARQYMDRIRYYEQSIVFVRNNTLIGKQGADEFPVSVRKSFEKNQAFTRSVDKLTFETNKDGKPVYRRTHGVIEFEAEVLEMLLKDLEACAVKYYFGKITHPQYNKPIAEFRIGDKVYVKLRHGFQLFEALRINCATSSNQGAGVGAASSATGVKSPTTSALETRYPAILILSKTIRGEERKLPYLDVSDFNVPHAKQLGLEGPLISTSYWSAYRHSDFKELKHLFHSQMTADAIKFYIVCRNALEAKCNQTSSIQSVGDVSARGTSASSTSAGSGAARGTSASSTSAGSGAARSDSLPVTSSTLGKRKKWGSKK
jgi:hypothetical protein